MKQGNLKFVALLFLVLWFGPAFGQANLFDHMYWAGYGQHERGFYGTGGISYLGKLNDTIPHALAISENYFDVFGGFGVVHSALVLNRFPGDTARVYEFRGQSVKRANFNGDAYPDFFCLDAGSKTIIILFGTARIDSFDTATVFHAAGPSLQALEDRIIIADLDSSGCDDALVLDVGGDRALLFRGGVGIDSMPATIIGHYASASGYLSLGRVRDKTHWFVCESNTGYGEYRNYAWILLYPVGAGFTFGSPTDSVLCTLDTSRYFRLTTGFQTVDVDADSIDDFLLSGYDTNYSPSLKINTTVFVYKGGAASSGYPAYFFHRPFQTYSSKFGTRMIDVGDVTGNGYHSLLVSDPEAFTDDGAIFLYNMGRARSDSCVAYAVSPSGGGSGYIRFGNEVAALPPFDSGGLPGFMTSDAGTNRDSEETGGVYIFQGSASYGPATGIQQSHDVPTALALLQNYPNPVSRWTIITFDLPGEHAERASVEILDIVGRKVMEVFRGSSDGTRHSIVVETSRLAPGTYVCRLFGGSRIASQLMQVMR